MQPSKLRIYTPRSVAAILLKIAFILHSVRPRFGIDHRLIKFTIDRLNIDHQNC